MSYRSRPGLGPPAIEPRSPTSGPRPASPRGVRIGRIPEHRHAGEPGQYLLEQFQALATEVRRHQELIPVTLPPGRARLATSPLPNGSPEAVMTIGMV